MKTKHIYRFLLLVLLAAFIACEKADSDKDWGNSLIYMPQAALLDGGNTIHYPVPFDRTAALQNYIIDSTETNTIKVILGVYRSGLEELQGYSVSVLPNPAVLQQGLAEIEDAFELPADLYSIPATVDVPDGQRGVPFYLTIDREKLLEEYGHLWDKSMIIALSLDKPTRYALNDDLNTVVVVINLADFLPKPPEPEVPDIISNGGFDNGNEHWQIMPQDKNPDGSIWSTGVPDISFAGGNMTISNTSTIISNYAIYQEVQVTAGKRYRFSTEMTSSGADNIWFEFYLGKEAPDPFGDYNPNQNETTMLAKLEAWGEGCLYGQVAGFVEDLACGGGAATNGGTVTYDFTGTAYFLIKIGTWDGTIGTITLDNIRILELD